MTQEELVSGLKERVGETSYSDQTFEVAAKSVQSLFADDGKVTDETWSIPVGILKGLQGQYNADVAHTVNSQKEKLAAENRIAQEKWREDFEAQWEKDHPAATSPASQPTPSADDDKIAKAVAAAMKEQNAKLFGEDGKSGILGEMGEFLKQSKAQAAEAKVASIRKELKDYLVEKGASLKREPLINLTVKQMQLDENSDIDKAKLEVEKAYERNYKDFYADGGKPFGGDSAGGGATAADGNLKKYLEGKAEEAKKEAEAADSLRKKFK